MRFFFATTAAFSILLAACADRVEVAQELRSEDDKECEKVGNSAQYIYCKVTFDELIKDPEKYDGEKIIFRGWTLLNEGGVSIFPSKQASESGRLGSSILLVSGSQRDALAGYLESSPEYNPRSIVVGGEFRARKAGAGSGDSGERLGELIDVEELRLRLVGEVR